MVRILGIDPGSRITGYGIIDTNSNHSTYVTCGTIKLCVEPLPLRLKSIFQKINEIVVEYAPDEVAIEQVFVHKNVSSALKLGQARGAAICGVVKNSLPVSEYSATEIKQATVGNGHAKKDQVQYMVKILLNLSEGLQVDEADALAVALCHSHARSLSRKLHALKQV